jgi:superfamily II DNA or RNA helicase
MIEAAAEAVASTNNPAGKISHRRKPEDMSLEAWQITLRRQFGREQNFAWKNIGQEKFFSEYTVGNPQTKRSYRVAIRGPQPGDNYCSCPDFAVNTLGTCKHIEFVLDKLEKKPGGKAALAAGFQPPYSEVLLRYGAKREVVFKPGRNCPDRLTRLAARFFAATGVLTPAGYEHFEAFLKEANALSPELRCYDDALAMIAQVRDDARRRARIGNAFPERLLKVPLYPYQREGALFAARTGRCLIADEMGLGKTIQAVAAAELLARRMGIERALIVAPTSLKHQWKQEIEKFSHRPAEVVEGPLARRAQTYASNSFFKIANYDVLHRDEKPIRDWKPDLIVLDEAQRIKNWKTRRAQSVKRLQSPYAIVLTGTPLENRLEDLHSIVEFVDRFRLGPLFRFLAGHQVTDDHGKVVGYRELKRIGETLKPILIRRAKKEVRQQLPKRLDKTFFVPMTEAQMQLHEENRETVARIVRKWRRLRFLTETDQRILMIALQNMRMACNSTYLLDQKTDFGTKADELIQLLAEILEDPEAKIVVFSQWLRTHEIIVRRLKADRWRHVLFHGGVPGPQRGGLIEQFKQDSQCRLFLATDAGGVGLNLQRASVVVNMDLPWNPAVLEQRIGRVHRLGQLRPVRVVNFVAQGTIEHGMLGVLSFKKSLFEGVLDGGKNEISLGGTRLKQFMETVEKATAQIPPAMPPLPETAKPEDEFAKAGGAEKAEAAPAGRPQSAWSDLIATGLSFLQQLAQAATADAAKAPGDALIGRDERTGERYLKLPMPNPETLKQIGGLLQALGGGQNATRP